MLEKKYQLEELRLIVQKIQKVVKELKMSGIKDKVLYKLIIDAAGSVKLHSYKREKLSLKMVEATIKGIENLDKYIYEEKK